MLYEVITDVLTLLCPECGVPLPTYDECSCGGDVIALFTRPVPDYGRNNFV